MKTITPYLMIAFYFVAAFFLIFVYRKENKGFLYIGAGMGFLGIWDILKLTVGEPLTSGVYLYIPKIICVIILLFACYMYVKERRNTPESTPDPRALDIPDDFDPLSQDGSGDAEDK